MGCKSLKSMGPDAETRWIMQNMEDVRLTHSGILSKGGKPYVSVRFERGGDYAEGCVPDCKILKYEGFNEGEARGLEIYLGENAKELLRRAKDISNVMNWMK